MFGISEKDLVRTTRHNAFFGNTLAPTYFFALMASRFMFLGAVSLALNLNCQATNKQTSHELANKTPPNLVLLAFMWKILFWVLLASSVPPPWKDMSFFPNFALSLICFR